MTIQQHASFDSSAAELNATSKLVKAWESKNAKNAAKAGGVSLMALSLAACGGSSTTTTTPVVDTPVVDTPVSAVSAVFAADVVDVLTGGAGNDTFRGDTGSVSGADAVDGGAGTDTVEIFVTDTSEALPQMSGVENLYLKATTINDIDVSATGITQLEIDGAATEIAGSAASETISLTSGQKLVLDSVTDGTGTAADSAGDGSLFADWGTATAATLVLDGVGAKTAASDLDLEINAEVVTLNVEGAGNSYAALQDEDGTANSKIKTLKISGDGMVDLGTGNLESVKTIDASENTGGVIVYADNTVNSKVITGGSGNDTFIMGTDVDVTDTIDLGAGDDTIEVDTGTLNSATATVKGINAAKNVERVATSHDDPISIDATVFTGVDIFEVTQEIVSGDATAKTDTIAFTMAAGDTLVLKGGSIYGGTGSAEAEAGHGIKAEAAVDGSSDAFTLEIDSAADVTIEGGDYSGSGSAGNDSNAGDGLYLGSVEVLNITTMSADDDLTVRGGDGSGTNEVAGEDIQAGANMVFNLSGAGDMDLGVITSLSTDVDDHTVNAGDMTGALTITFGAGNDTIVSGSGDDVLSMGTGMNTITTGAGEDKVIITAQEGASSTGTFKGDTITDFNAGVLGDVLQFAATSNAGYYEKLTSSELSDAEQASNLHTAAESVLADVATNYWSAFTFAGKTYAVHDSDGDAGLDSSDALVLLEGVELSALTTDNFIG